VAIDEFHLTMDRSGGIFDYSSESFLASTGVSAALPQRLLGEIIPLAGIRSNHWLKQVKLDQSKLYPMIPYGKIYRIIP
jgi:hypothetical protein